MRTKEAVYESLGGKLEKSDILDIESGIFESSYEIFNTIVDGLNEANKDVGFSIEFALTDSFNFNAHAAKVNEYVIIFRSGVVIKTLHNLGREFDFYKNKFESIQLTDIEAPIALGCSLIWIQMFTHELGHIIRGHNDLSKKGNIFNMLGPAQELSTKKILADLSINEDELKFLIEIDADVFSSLYIADTVIKWTKNPMDGSLISEKDILTICFSSIFFFFNWVGENNTESIKYPPAMLRSHILFDGIVRYLNGKLNLNLAQIKDIERDVLYQCYSFLDDYDSFTHDMSVSGLDKLESAGIKAQESYPDFANYISLNISKLKVK